MYLLEPSRLQQALAVLDSDRDGQIDCLGVGGGHRERPARPSSRARAAQRRAQEMMERQAAKDLEEFTNEFQNAARHCFELIDVDKGGTLSLAEVVAAVHPKTGIEKVLKFLRTCGEPNLQFLTQPARLDKALEVLDTSKDGEVDSDEWEEAINRGLAKRLEQLADERERRERAAAKADGEFSAEFLNAARQCLPHDRQGRLRHAREGGDRPRRPGRQEGDQVPRELRQPEPHVPAGAVAPRGLR